MKNCNTRWPQQSVWCRLNDASETTPVSGTGDSAARSSHIAASLDWFLHQLGRVELWRHSKRNLDHLDWVIAEWSHLQAGSNSENPLATDVHVPALNFIRQTRPQVRIIPMVQNLIDEKWNSDLLARNIADEASSPTLD